MRRFHPVSGAGTLSLLALAEARHLIVKFWRPIAFLSVKEHELKLALLDLGRGPDEVPDSLDGCSRKPCYSSGNLLGPIHEFLSIDDFAYHPCIGHPFRINRDPGQCEITRSIRTHYP